MHDQSLQSCPTLCDAMDCSPPGSSVHGILQARMLEWVAMLSSRGSCPPRDRASVSFIAGRCFTTDPPGKHPSPQLPTVVTHSCAQLTFFETVQWQSYLLGGIFQVAKPLFPQGDEGLLREGEVLLELGGSGWRRGVKRGPPCVGYRLPAAGQTAGRRTSDLAWTPAGRRGPEGTTEPQHGHLPP